MSNETEQIYILNTSENHSSSEQKFIDLQLVQSTRVNLENVEDFSNVCRICATITEFVMPIFDREGVQNNLAEKIHKHLPIQVSKEDLLPRVVCYQCASTVLAWHELVQCCVQADAALRTKLLVLKETKDNKVKTVNIEAGQSTIEDEKKCKETNNFIVQKLNESQNTTKVEALEQISDLKLCSYCEMTLPKQNYKDHLLTTHAEMMFHCDECSCYVDKKNLVIHMAVHASEYDENEEGRQNKKKITTNENNRNLELQKEKAAKENPNSSTLNEFSDNSDMENDVILPESVLRSVEDSQSRESEEIDFGIPLVNRLSGNSTPLKPVINLNEESQSMESEEIDVVGLTPVRRSFGNDTSAKSILNFIEGTENMQSEEIDFGIPMTNRPIAKSASPKSALNFRESGQIDIIELTTVNMPPGNSTLEESVIEFIEESQSGESEEIDVVGIPPANTPLTQSMPPKSGLAFLNESQDIESKKADVVELSSANKLPDNSTPKDDNSKKSRTCPICSKVYTASSSYFYHMRYSHKTTKDYSCETCGNKFGTRASLLQHDAVHTSEYKFACKQCGKKFRSKASEYIHEQTHTGVKTYACEQCPSSFRWKTHLSRHMKRHSAEKKHVCTTCGRGFNIHCDLLRHMRTHEAGKFECRDCGLTFLQERYLRVHMNKKHSTVALVPPAVPDKPPEVMKQRKVLRSDSVCK